MTFQEVSDFIRNMLSNGSTAADTSTALVHEAIRKWHRNEVVADDTTATAMHMTVRISNGVSWAERPNAQGESILIRILYELRE